jgi:nicotinamidase-related amidase
MMLPKDQTAILIMDCQNDIVDERGKMATLSDGTMARVIKEKNVLSTIARLAATGRNTLVPIIYVRHAYRPDYADVPLNMPLLTGVKRAQSLQDGTWGAEIHPNVAPHTGNFVITKTRVSAFYSSSLEALLSSHEITHLVLTGIATDGVVEGTARNGADRSYYVIIPEDCCVGTSEEAHRVILGGIMRALTIVCRAEEVIDSLGQIAQRKLGAKGVNDSLV